MMHLMLGGFTLDALTLEKVKRDHQYRCQTKKRYR
jgi:hypothetical protein